MSLELIHNIVCFFFLKWLTIDDRENFSFFFFLIEYKFCELKSCFDICATFGLAKFSCFGFW